MYLCIYLPTYLPTDLYTHILRVIRDTRSRIIYQHISKSVKSRHCFLFSAKTGRSKKFRAIIKLEESHEQPAARTRRILAAVLRSQTRAIKICIHLRLLLIHSFRFVLDLFVTSFIKKNRDRRGLRLLLLLFRAIVISCNELS